METSDFHLRIGGDISAIFSGPDARERAEGAATEVGQVPGEVTVTDDRGSIVWTPKWRRD